MAFTRSMVKKVAATPTVTKNVTNKTVKVKTEMHNGVKVNNVTNKNVKFTGNGPLDYIASYESDSDNYDMKVESDFDFDFDQVDSDTNTESDANTESDTHTESDTNTNTNTESDTNTNTNTESDTNTNTESDTEYDETISNLSRFDKMFYKDVAKLMNFSDCQTKTPQEWNLIVRNSTNYSCQDIITPHSAICSFCNKFKYVSKRIVLGDQIYLAGRHCAHRVKLCYDFYPWLHQSIQTTIMSQLDNVIDQVLNADL